MNTLHISNVIFCIGVFPSLCVAFTVTDGKRNVSISYEKLVTKHLLETYQLAGRGGRPVVDGKSPTEVQFGLGLIQMDLDEKKKILSMSMWAHIKWVDEYLTWNPADFGGINKVRLNQEEIWIPDIMLFNTADPDPEEKHVPIQVTSDGLVQWVPHQIFRSSCSIDVTLFPFDNQTCHLWFGSWTHSVYEINLTFSSPHGIDLSTFTSDYKDSCEWDIYNTEAERGGEENGYILLQITLHLKRKLVFSSYIFTLPCIFLAFLTLVVFCLPPERPDRTGLAMSLFSSFLVLLLILVEAAPPTASSVPKLGIYYCFNMSIIMLSIFLSSLVVNVNKMGEGGKVLPKLIDIVFLHVLGHVLLVSVKPCCKKKQNNSTVPTAEEDHLLSNTNETLCNGLDVQSASANRGTSQTQDHSDVDQKIGEITMHLSQVGTQIMEVQSGLHQLLTNMSSKDASCKGLMVQKWESLGSVLDRLFILAYLVAIILSLMLIFPVPPLDFIAI